MNYDAIFEGGGTKIPGLVGALQAIETRGFTPSHLAGSSAGAIVAACRVAGYTPDELKDLITDMNFKKFKDGGHWGTKAFNILRHKGIYKGDVFYRTMQDLMKAKGVTYFGDLKSSVADELNDPKYRYRLKVTSADISYERLITWPDDAAMFGLQPEYVEVAWAIRCSMSIPYFFRPVKLNDSYIVDGGVLSNFPIWMWDSYSSPEWPTFGILLEEANSGEPHKIKGPISFLEAMFQTMLKAHDRQFIRPEDFRYRTIRVPVGNAKATNFNLSTQEKEKLCHSGLQAGSTFLSNWQWSDYLAWAKKSRGIVG